MIPWAELSAVIEPFSPKADRILRIHFLQHGFNLSDPAVEDALYDFRAMHRFVGIDLGREPAPDETTICKFRHLLERHNLGDRLFALIAEYLQENGLKVCVRNPPMDPNIGEIDTIADHTAPDSADEWSHFSARKQMHRNVAVGMNGSGVP